MRQSGVTLPRKPQRSATGPEGTAGGEDLRPESGDRLAGGLRTFEESRYSCTESDETIARISALALSESMLVANIRDAVRA